MSDLVIDVEAACAAARRYAQLVYYHDNATQSQYRVHPFWAWRDFIRQFSAIPRGVIITSMVSHSYLMELRRLVEEARARRSGGPLPPLADRDAGIRPAGVHESGGGACRITSSSAISIVVYE